jgi:hypothetical protein
MEDLGLFYFDRACAPDAGGDEWIAAGDAGWPMDEVVASPRPAAAAEAPHPAPPAVATPTPTIQAALAAPVSRSAATPDPPAGTGTGTALAGSGASGKSRSCEASARYRRRKQTELETLRKQYLDMFAENKQLLARVEQLEDANQRLTARLALYETTAP